MGSHAVGVARLEQGKSDGAAPAFQVAAWDRFGGLNPHLAKLVLLAFGLLLIAAALVPIRTPENSSGAALTAMLDKSPADTSQTEGAENAAVPVKYPQVGRYTRTEGDLALYDIAIDRIAKGENYYDFIAAEQRRIGYPVKPALAFRLPTLAVISAAVSPSMLPVPGFALLLCTLAAWWRKLGDEPGMRRLRTGGIGLLFAGASLAINPYYLALHEVWAGLFVALSLGLHRPSSEDGKDGRWIGALAAAALALSIRELALPFVLLMGAFAHYRRQWREGIAWTVLALAFIAAFAVHLHVLGAQALPADQEGPGWLQLRGLSGWLSNVVMSSMLRQAPHWIAGPLVVLMLLGWAGWRSATGTLVTLLQAGYALSFAIAGRWDNFYWGLIVSPVLFIGLAMAPRALRGLCHAAAK